MRCTLGEGWAFFSARLTWKCTPTRTRAYKHHLYLSTTRPYYLGITLE